MVFLMLYWFLEYFLPFVLVLTVLVFIHELGHFLAARHYGVKVDVFSIGFGKELFGFTDKKGTRWRFSLIPLGGYVKMFGDADVSSARADETKKQSSFSLHSKTPMQKIVVAFAGPLANYILAFILLIGIFAIKGMPFLPSYIGLVQENSPAQKAGILSSDKIVSINHENINGFLDIGAKLEQFKDQDSINITVERQGKTIDLEAKMYEITEDGQKKRLEKLGISPMGQEYQKVSFYQAIIGGLWYPIELSYQTLVSIGKMLTGKKGTGELGGIIAIGDMASNSVKNGVSALIFFMALLSVNLGLINLLPIPVLDGGQIMISAIEGIRGKSLSEKVKEYIFMVGFAMVIAMMIFSTWNDISRYKIWQTIKGFWKW
jgi:regulator of sigma E protease